MAEEVTETSRAWLLDFGKGLQAAVGLHEMWQVLISPVLFDVPCTPNYCSRVLVFQNNRIIPVLDIASLFEGKNKPTSSSIVGVAIYQETYQSPIHYAGLQLATLPQSIYVSDDQACELPNAQKYWEPLILSCFYREGVIIPVLNLSYIFSKDLKVNQGVH